MHVQCLKKAEQEQLPGGEIDKEMKDDMGWLYRPRIEQDAENWLEKTGYGIEERLVNN